MQCLETTRQHSTAYAEEAQHKQQQSRESSPLPPDCRVWVKTDTAGRGCGVVRFCQKAVCRHGHVRSHARLAKTPSPLMDRDIEDELYKALIRAIP